MTTKFTTATATGNKTTMKSDTKGIEKQTIKNYFLQVFGYTWARANPKNISFADKHDLKVLEELAESLSNHLNSLKNK